MPLNETLASAIPPPLSSTVTPWRRGSSFPYSQYKDLMPEDQFAKLLAMHENSTANAALYVAVVLAVYIILLSLLLCRYVRRRPPIRELPPLMVAPPPTTGQKKLGGCISVPWRHAVRHCTFHSGAEVASASSEDIENDEHDHSHVRQDRRDSTIIKMTQLQNQADERNGASSKPVMEVGETQEEKAESNA